MGATTAVHRIGIPVPTPDTPVLGPWVDATFAIVLAVLAVERLDVRVLLFPARQGDTTPTLWVTVGKWTVTIIGGWADTLSVASNSVLPGADRDA